MLCNGNYHFNKQITVIYVIYSPSIIQCTNLLQHVFCSYNEKLVKVNIDLEAWWLICKKWCQQCMICRLPSLRNWGKKTKPTKCFVVAKFVCSLKACNSKPEKFSKDLQYLASNHLLRKQLNPCKFRLLSLILIPLNKLQTLLKCMTQAFIGKFCCIN